MKERSKESKERKAAAVVVEEKKKEKETTTTSRAGVPPRATREASLLKSRRTRCFFNLTQISQITQILCVAMDVIGSLLGYEP